MTILSVKASQILVNQVWELIRGWDAFKKKAFRSFKASQLSIKSGSRFVGDWDALPFKTQKSPDRIKNMPETKPQAKFFELRQATGFRLKAVRSDGQVYVGVPAKEANYYMLIAGYRRSTSAFLKSGRTYYFNLEVFRKLYPQEHELWDQVEQQAAAL